MTSPTPATDPASKGAARNRGTPSSTPSAPTSLSILPEVALPIEADDQAAAFRSLIEAYLKPADVAKVEAALDLATASHEGQTRQS
ncbi:MAG: hypothetical protein JNK75_09720, partial [Betaproteobacteria bacterium]|nr:hypothetical protein [Betaproteobacteria bacterium]